MSEPILDKILTELLNLKEYVFTKVATRDDLDEAKHELMQHIDGLNKRQTTLDHEQVSMRARVERVEGRVERLETKIG